MAIVLAHPQFQVLTHVQTGAVKGRIYFPALFLAEFSGAVIKWLQRQEISFEEKDLKIYSDGSFRIYFKTRLSPEIEYLALIKIIENI
ncbi:hypothetical protein DSM106972_049330 [Dulcicalothrix desertica PCC 7102]|uniref:Uncharacterized protein n=1 Tax=Dulcicalothrix desertica PCC 7102 TaxID=232991 RepID=A0A3S1CIA6_9CYAN|nr:hypothetical protein [Dulcicalothrix desertica]RUT04019.1 hypothetical protein DSM106972_049330 [Dulcicalothrix desertica PCC 7102]TWH43575.1 hypothetical protein CAL7102_07310 [Dulcicalothrix desertica PCC 7102]